MKIANIASMLCFPNAKVNIGLRVLNRRADGYHNIETVFCPVDICDMLEFVTDDTQSEKALQLNLSGYDDTGKQLDNLCAKAYYLLHNDFQLPPISVYLHKLIPVGAGLGGGSSDAAFMLKYLNSFFDLAINEDRLCEYASQLGSDCAFFIRNRPLLGYERGNSFREINFSMDELEIIVIHPGIHISTAEAYAGVVPQESDTSLEELISLPIETWRKNISNNFETSVFIKYPAIAEIKNLLYEQGAVYASMSGSGSSVYGLFHQAPDIQQMFKGMFYWKGLLSQKPFPV